MNVQIEDPELDDAAEEIAKVTGESLDELVRVAVKERLERVQRRKGRELLASLDELLGRVGAMPELDPRPADEIIGYNEHGHFD